MNKAEFKRTLAKLYACGNRSDGDDKQPDEISWVHPNMAGQACCAKLDAVIQEMVDCGVFTEADRCDIYDDL